MKPFRLIVDVALLAAGAAGGIYWGVNHPNEAADIARREQVAADKAKVQFLEKFASHIPNGDQLLQDAQKKLAADSPGATTQP
jgi:NAD-dependent oxidoreductase involved in siderophore biosynthesis